MILSNSRIAAISMKIHSATTVQLRKEPNGKPKEWKEVKPKEKYFEKMLEKKKLDLANLQ